MKSGAALLLAAAAVALAGCSTSSESPSAESTSKPSSTFTAAPAQDAGCYPARAIDDVELAAFAAGLQLPAGVQVVTGRVSTDSDQPGLVGVALDLCVPGESRADALRPIATTIATALKPTDLGKRTFALYVADLGPAANTEAKIKDADYKVHSWNGRPSAKAELDRWEVVSD